MVIESQYVVDHMTVYEINMVLSHASPPHLSSHSPLKLAPLADWSSAGLGDGWFLEATGGTS